MIELYFHGTPNPRKVVLLLEELGLPYRLVPVDTYKGEQHQPAFRAINPNGKVPALVDGEAVLFDSSAILLYLAEREQRLLGPAAMRPGLLSWLMFVASGVGPYSGQAVHFSRVHTESAYASNRYRREVERHYTVLDARLQQSVYIAGPEYSIVDISAWGWLMMADFILGQEQALAAWPALQAWFTKVDARPAAVKARGAGSELTFKTEFDAETMRALFPQNVS
jgi:GSH-dependent disulfide-bond oxidoreductase